MGNRLCGLLTSFGWSILAACFPGKDFSSVLCMTLKLLADQQGFGQTASWPRLNTKASGGKEIASMSRIKKSEFSQESDPDPSTIRGKMIPRW